MTATFPTPLTPTTRYFPVALRRVYFLPAVANVAAPTRAELTAGTDLTGEVVDGGISGFTLTGAAVDVPDLASIFTANIPGRQTAASSSISFYLDQGGNDVRTLFLAATTSSLATTGFILILPAGEWVTGKTKTMDVWPVRVLSDGLNQSTADGGQTTVEFAIPASPAVNVLIPSNP